MFKVQGLRKKSTKRYAIDNGSETLSLWERERVRDLEP
jgi:hypothetical protein